MQIESPGRISEPETSHYEESSAREKLVEHVFLGELLRGLWRRNVRDLEVLRPEVDSGGYDLALEYRGLTRHVQLKSSHRDAKRATITANLKLLDRPSACILWIYFDPDTMLLGPYLWFGGAPKERIPSFGKRSQGIRSTTRNARRRTDSHARKKIGNILRHGCRGRQRIRELACDSKGAANLRRPTSRFAEQHRYPGFIPQKALQFRQH